MKVTITEEAYKRLCLLTPQLGPYVAGDTKTYECDVSVDAFNRITEYVNEGETISDAIMRLCFLLEMIRN